MKLFKAVWIPACSLFFVFAVLTLFCRGVSYAETNPLQPSNQNQLLQKKEPVSAVTPFLKLCPDLKATLSMTKSASGLVKLTGTITNIGNKDFHTPSEAQYFMNLSYPPKTYNQIGVSEQLLGKEFTQIRKGASFPVNLTYQIPGFAGWVKAGDRNPVAKRLFTLRFVKKDMSLFNAGEECHPENNSMSIEIEYMEK